MKTSLKIISLFILFALNLLSANETTRPSISEKRQKTDEGRFVPGEEARQTRRQLDQLQDLEFFINLPNHKLEQTKMLIERISKMSQEEKEEIKQKIERFKNLNKQKQEELFERYQKMPAIDKYALWKHFSSMTSEQRQEENEKFRSLNEEERTLHNENIIKKFKEENPNFEVPSDFKTPRENRHLKQKDDTTSPNKQKRDEPNFRNKRNILDDLQNEQTGSSK